MSARRALGPNDPWLQTRSGRAINLVNPFHGDVDFEDIAEALGQINRFAGHCRKPLSVACHTLAVADLAAAIEPTARPWALLHDAHEAYLGDITTPVAFAFGQSGSTMLRDLKHRHDEAILIASGLPVHAGYPGPAARSAVAHADALALMWERRDLLGPPPRPWHPLLEALVLQIPRRAYPYLPGPIAATQLMTEFRAHLPHLRPGPTSPTPPTRR